MNLLQSVVMAVKELLMVDMTIFGFTFSLWDVFLFDVIGSAVAGSVVWFIWGD